jgi:hypothetical protein
MKGGVLERVLWWVLLLLFPKVRVAGVWLVDIRVVPKESRNELCLLLRAAFKNLEIAKGGFAELVRAELRIVAATRESSPRVSGNLRAYLSPFAGFEATNETYLAATLVYAAAFVREWHAISSARLPAELDLKEVRSIARTEQLRFAEALPNGDRWVNYFRE